MDLLWGFRISGLIYNFGRQGSVLSARYTLIQSTFTLRADVASDTLTVFLVAGNGNYSTCYPAASKIVPNRAPRDAHSPQGVLSKSKKGALGVYIKILIKYKEGSKLARLKRSKSRREV